jgi:hypothetical protein
LFFEKQWLQLKIKLQLQLNLKKKALLTHEPEHKQNYEIEKNKPMQLNPSDSAKWS